MKSVFQGIPLNFRSLVANVRKFCQAHRWFAPVFFLVVVFGLSFLLRLEIFTQFATFESSTDYARDYLVSHHMVAYGELPMYGPFGRLGPTANSPAYYYLLAAFLLIKDSILFLGFMNVFLQALCVVLVFGLARLLFGNKTAYIASVFFCLFDFFVEQAFDLWQPYIMQPFLTLSLLLLAWGFKKRNDVLLWMSGSVFVFAATLHNSVLAITPLYIIAIFSCLYVQKPKLHRYVLAFSSMVATAVLLYLPLVLYFLKVHPARYADRFITPYGKGLSLEVLAQNIFSSLSTFFATVFHLPPYLGVYVGAVFFLVCWWYVAQERNRNKRIIVLFIISALFYNACAVGFLHIHADVPIFLYFTPVYVLMTILTAELIVNLPLKIKLSFFIKVGIFALILHAGFTSDIFSRPQNLFHSLDFKMAHHDTEFHVSNDLPFIYPTLDALMQKEGIHSFRYFAINRPNINYINDSLFWVPLEEHYGIPFVELPTTTGGEDFVPLAPDTYVVVRCVTQSVELCANYFLSFQLPKQPKQYVVEKVIYVSEFSVYLLARRVQ